MRIALVPLVLLAATACEIPDALVNIPLELESEEFSFNVTEVIENWEADACTDTSSNECKVITALDEADDGSASSPPTIPASIPQEIEVEQCFDGVGCASTTVDILEWADDEGLLDELKSNLSYAAPIDVQEVADQVGVSVDGSNGVEVQSITLNWIANGLNFDTVDLDLYVADGLDNDSTDAQALIDSGAATMVGTLPAANAGATGAVDVVFAEGGAAALDAALLSKQFTAVIAVADPDLASLLPIEGGNILKPAGDATVQVQSVVQFEAGEIGN